MYLNVNKVQAINFRRRLLPFALGCRKNDASVPVAVSMKDLISVHSFAVLSIKLIDLLSYTQNAQQSVLNLETSVDWAG